MNPISFNGYYLTGALLALCTICGILVAARFRREVDEDLAPTTSEDLLGPLEKAYYAGLMRPEEIERIRASVQSPPSTGTFRPMKPASGLVGQGGDLMFDRDVDRGPVKPPAAD